MGDIHRLGHVSEFENVWWGKSYSYIREMTGGRCPVDQSIDVPRNKREFITGESVGDW